MAENVFVPHRRKRILTHINNDVFRLSYQYASRYERHDHRVYEPQFYLPSVEQARAGMTVFDIGAHIGLFTLGAGKRIGQTGHVFAFEAAPATVPILRQHVAMNGLQDRVTVVPAAVSDKTGTVSFYTNGVSMANSLSQTNVEVLNRERSNYPDTPLRAERLDVPAITIDDFCESRKSPAGLNQD